MNPKKSDFISPRKRSFVRIPHKGWLTYEKCGLLPSNRKFSGDTQNISGGGILFTTNQDIPVGALINLDLPIPAGHFRDTKPVEANEEGNPVTITAGVLRTNEIAPGEFEIAACFVDMTDEDQEKILNLIKEAATDDK